MLPLTGTPHHIPPMHSPTLGHFALMNMNVHIRCDDGACIRVQKFNRHYGTTLHASEAAELWGEETTLEEVRSRARCQFCGKRGANMVADVSFNGASPGASGGMG